MLTMHEGDNFRTSDMKSGFEFLKVKSIKTGPSFVGIMRLVTGLSEERERL